jgi:hypothetical protein
LDLQSLSRVPEATAGAQSERCRWQPGDMPTIGDDDQFESEYMAQLRTLLTRHGVPLTYDKDRAGIDTGLHLFVEGPSGFDATHARVWFQVKGKRTTTMPLETFHDLSHVDVKVAVGHLRFWSAAPEPVYLAVYIESADVFVAEDVRDIVERQWPGGSFYGALLKMGESVTVHVDASKTLDSTRVESMLAHRSMRIDGPAFRGRPLGHRFDPLRSQIEVCSPPFFQRLVDRILAAHDFRLRETIVASDTVRLSTGRLYQTLEWQSPAFAEFGVGPHDDFRDEPPVESIHGSMLLVCDLEPARRELTAEERGTFGGTLDDIDQEARVAVIFNGRDLSGTGGLWRSTLRDLGAFDRPGGATMLGLEAVTSLLLVATLVYLDVAPELSWRYVNYQ